MKSTDALRVVAEVTAHQWGMVTSAQARRHGVSRLDLSRLAADDFLERLVHGVYKVTGAPGDRFDPMRAAWLSTDPSRFAFERGRDIAGGVVFAGASAARLHGIGDMWDRQHDFMAPTRRQSQRAEVRYRQRALEPRDVTVVEGLPVLTLEATIADLFNAEADLSHIADALRDAAGQRGLDLAHLEILLAPHASRHGLRKDDGGGLLQRLLEIAGLDVDSLARFLTRSPTYASLAHVTKIVGNLETAPRYNRAMTEIATPTRRPLTGPTGRRVAAHRSEAREVLRRHGVTDPEIFGSVARGDDREDSDLDLLVDFAPGTDIIDIIGIQRELQEVLGVPVDLVPRTGLKERVRERAAKDLLPL